MKRGLTLVEVLVVLLIAAVLMAILLPILISVKNSARITAAVSDLHQLDISLNLYRSDWNGNDSSFDSYYDLGLPPVRLVQDDLTPKWDAILKSPCGLNVSAVNSAMLPGRPGYASPVFATGDPGLAKQAPEFRDHISTFRQNAVMFIDVNCADADANFNDRYSTKRGLAVLFSGQLVNKNSEGIASSLTWYTTLPTN